MFVVPKSNFYIVFNNILIFVTLKALLDKVKQISNYTLYRKYNFIIFVVPKFDFCKILLKIFLNFAKKKNPYFY